METAEEGLQQQQRLQRKVYSLKRVDVDARTATHRTLSGRIGESVDEGRGVVDEHFGVGPASTCCLHSDIM